VLIPPGAFSTTLPNERTLEEAYFNVVARKISLPT
jgi:hypothetical protein